MSLRMLWVPRWRADGQNRGETRRTSPAPCAGTYGEGDTAAGREEAPAPGFWGVGSRLTAERARRGVLRGGPGDAGVGVRPTGRKM